MISSCLYMQNNEKKELKKELKNVSILAITNMLTFSIFEKLFCAFYFNPITIRVRHKEIGRCAA